MDLSEDFFKLQSIIDRGKQAHYLHLSAECAATLRKQTSAELSGKEWQRCGTTAFSHYNSSQEISEFYLMSKVVIYAQRVKILPLVQICQRIVFFKANQPAGIAKFCVFKSPQLFTNLTDQLGRWYCAVFLWSLLYSSNSVTLASVLDRFGASN